jgi:hypothetical protein
MYGQENQTNENIMYGQENQTPTQFYQESKVILPVINENIMYGQENQTNENIMYGQENQTPTQFYQESKVILPVINENIMYGQKSLFDDCSFHNFFPSNPNFDSIDQHTFATENVVRDIGLDNKKEIAYQHTFATENVGLDIGLDNKKELAYQHSFATENVGLDIGLENIKEPFRTDNVVLDIGLENIKEPFRTDNVVLDIGLENIKEPYNALLKIALENKNETFRTENALLDIEADMHKIDYPASILESYLTSDVVVNDRDGLAESELRIVHGDTGRKEGSVENALGIDHESRDKVEKQCEFEKNVCEQSANRNIQTDSYISLEIDKGTPIFSQFTDENCTEQRNSVIRRKKVARTDSNIMGKRNTRYQTKPEFEHI